MAFGLSGAPATFQRILNSIFGTSEFVLGYQDDLIVHSKDKSDHKMHLENVIKKLSQNGFTINLNKSKFFMPQVSYLGHLFSKNGVSTNPAKTEVIQKCPSAKNAKEVKSFLGLASYYRKFVKKFANIAKPLHDLSENNKSFV
ncbi:Retrovirus-related Pol polyprotein from transposon 17.6 [Thelohanellus kitauei]|uniref:Retrovirus-related Pol polyprotein from transposon 17.6 n=1 Tax=Thelohanellus kitauei TaxID=669202 RepID=A0A0C2M819_THEKT|nr:Retrovirus-related Pol polyprotein from transposon 17.6 [Thelohanellus kitauei]